MHEVCAAQCAEQMVHIGDVAAVHHKVTFCIVPRVKEKTDVQFLTLQVGMFYLVASLKS